MTGPCRTVLSLCLALAPVVAGAEEPGEPLCLPENPDRAHALRYLFVRQEPTEKVEEIYVAGGVPTIIRLPADLHVRGTGIGGGGRQRFTLLMGGRQILLTPKKDLVDDERFPMWVTLADGMIIHLSLTRAPEGERTDGEVQISRSLESVEAAGLRAQLVSMTEKAKGFEVSLRQALKEQESHQYALAGLIVAGRADLTALSPVRDRRVPGNAFGSRQLRIRTFASRRAKEIAAFLKVTNHGPQALDLSTGRLYRLSAASGAEPIPFALRAQPSRIPPGGEGRVAVVIDREQAFGPDGEGKLLLDFLTTHRGGALELSAELAPEDFVVQDTSSGARGPF